MTDERLPTKDELNEARKWLEANRNELPQAIFWTLLRMLAVYSAFAQSAAKAKQTLARLREAMGIKPKSERGSSLGAGESSKQEPLSLEEMTPSDREQYELIKTKRDQMLLSLADYNRNLRILLPKPKAFEQLELDLVSASELMFSEKASSDMSQAKKQTVDRMSEFDRDQGLHVTYDYTKRVDLKIVVTDIDYQVETVTDPRTGKSVRASMADEGPEKFRMTWDAIANLVKLHVGFAIPINRLSLIIGRPEFSSGSISRIMLYVATVILPIYLYMVDELSESEILSGDDTKTKVLEVSYPSASRKVEDDSLAKRIEGELGWAWPRADGRGDKTGLNVSLISGRSKQKDPRSQIRLFRTHLGSVGNLLTSILERRSPKTPGPLIFQGDLSTTNLPRRELMEKFDLEIAGCGAHARRPFWRWKEEDPILCYFMLRGFLALSRLEDRIDAKGRTHANVLRMRGRYGRKIWEAIYNRCVAATTGHSPGRFTLNKRKYNDVWPPGHDLHVACKYVINHFDELTLYLGNAYLAYTNNVSERGVRIEKCMLSGSKFRKTRNGRAVLDILRTINATCTAAGVGLRDYLCYVCKHAGELQSHPENFTPYAVALHFEKQKAL